MKRIREDAYGGSQLKRPFDSSRGDSYEQSQPPVGRGGGSSGVGTGGSSSHKLTTTDALSYLKEVKEMFQDQKDRYDLFLEIMKDFKAQRTDTTGVIARVKELFKGHNNLIFGFNTFLPKGYEITLDDEEAPPKKTVEFQEAISFVNKIKRRFQNDEHIYKTFLDILNMYRKEHKDINEVYSEVAVLFVEHPDLLAEFIRFLPDSSATPSTDHIAYGRNSATHFNEQNYPAPMLQNGQVDKRYRQSPHNDLHLSYDRTEMDDDRVMMEVHKDQKRRAEKENRDRRNRDQDVRELEQDNIRDFNSQRMSDKRKSTRRVEGFGMNAYFSSYDDKDGLKGMYDQGFIFCEKVKETLCSSDDYQAFLKCLHIYSNGIIKRNDLQNLVTDLLGKYPDLMDEFNDFLERCENIDGFLAGIMSKKSRVSDGHLSRSMKVEDRDKEQKRELEYCKERERIREKYMAKSIQELDLSNCQCCTPSYRLLPEDYPIPSASHRTELGVEVLNNHWVSVTSGSEDYSFKHMCRNQYEESLFKCEDDRFELDMLLESVSSTAKRAEDVLNNINENKLNVDAPICIEDHLTALNLRCIERLYGDHGLDVMDILRRNPSLALPVILTRLKQKQEEWTRCRSDFNKVWAEIYAKNHYKSLDHCSFYFKQQDSKNLSAKSLHAEIKELKELKQKEDDIILAIGAKNQHPIMPQLEFEYPDISIHEDLYKLIKYSCEELCSTKEQLSKVMKLWTTFLEPILGVTSHPRSCEDNKVVSKGRNHASNFMASNIRENSESPDGDATIDDSKHPNSDRNDDIHALPEPAGLCMGGLVKDNLAKGNDILSVPRSSGDNLVCNSALWPQKELNNVDSTVKASGLNKQVASGEEVATYNASLAGEASNSHCRYIHEETSGRATVPLRPNTGTCEGNPVAKVDISVVHSLEAQSGGDTKLPLLENIMNIEVGKVNKGLEESIGPSIIEKEEGELSPNGDAEEDDFPVIPLSKGNTGGENCANANIDDEDSENVFRAGKGVSGSDSAGDECSREKLEEEEDGEHGQIVGKAESEGEAEGITDAHFVGDGTSFPLPECFLQSVKPLARHVPMIPPAEQRKESYVFYGNDDFYMLFRLHQVLYDRILSAKKNSVGAEMKWRTPQDSDTSNPYARFMTALYNLLDGSVDNTKFEDECRSIIGNQSYSLFTLDKLIYKLVKQLQTVATDEMDLKLIQLYEYEKIRKSGIIDCVYHDNVWVLSHEEKMYRFGYISTPSMLSIQLMDSICEKPEMLAVSVEPNFSTYLHNEFLTISPEKEHRFLLKRNFKKYAGLDGVAAICLAMKCVKSVYNGLECKMACDSSKDQIQARKSEKQKRTRNRFGGHILKTTYVMSTADSFARASRPIEYKIRRKLPAHLNL